MQDLKILDNDKTDWFSDFISRYSYLYFEPESLSGMKGIYENCYQSSPLTEESRNSCLKKVGITKLGATHYKAEDEAMKCLNDGRFNKDALAWKTSKLKWDEENNKLLYFAFESEDKKNYRNGLGNPIIIADFQNYCEKLKGNKKSITEDLPKLEPLTDINEWLDKWQDFIQKHLKEYDPPKNIGPVYIINALFFLSKGKVPIYDAFAHKAIRALALDISPNQVFLGANPGRDNPKGMATMYCEYMLLLKKVFAGHVFEDNDMFISRELDRALWVYGHATKKYQPYKD